MPKFVTSIRDISFFILFLVFSKNAFERSIIHMQEERPSPWKKFDVHQLDKGFLAAVTATKQQINQAISVVKNEDVDKEKKLQDMRTQLEQIEKKYKKNSPVTYLLGPLGTTAIVLKEKRLENELLGIIEDFGTILYTLNQNNQEENIEYSIEVSSIESGIIQNKDLLNQLPAPCVVS